MRADPLVLETHSDLSWKSQLNDLYELTKPRITYNVLITTFTGMWLAAGGPPAWPLIVLTLLGVAFASASSCSFNNYIDRHIDKDMQRTQNRPLPTGRLQPKTALILGSILGVLSFIVLYFGVNLLTASLAVFSNFFYVIIYTLWLKRTTPLCTSLGGVAGAMPAVLGVTAVANQITPVAIALFGFMYLWQPPHFWALALIKTEEYRKVGIPMLPVVKGERVTKRQMLLYTIALLPASLSLFWLGVTGWVYFATATVMSLVYLGLTIDFIRKPVTRKAAYRLFFFSIIYLCVLFVMMFVNNTPVGASVL